MPGRSVWTGPAPAAANGRFPETNQLVVEPGNPNTFAVRFAGAQLCVLQDMDIHVGEGCSGTISGDFPPCFREPDYARMKKRMKAPVIFELVRRVTRYSTRIRLRNWTAI